MLVSYITSASHRNAAMYQKVPKATPISKGIRKNDKRDGKNRASMEAPTIGGSEQGAIEEMEVSRKEDEKIKIMF